ncbi:MAG: hypothetical protein R3C40_11655 [Parvularculaceae bacterium]
MILRRIAEHVKAQNWTAVARFVIVVAGVFIGIQVSNWNDALAESARERQALAAILDDLRADRQMLKNAMEMAQVNIDASNQVFHKAGFAPVEVIAIPESIESLLEGAAIKPPSPSTLPEIQKANLWARITMHYYPSQSDAAVAALIATGNLHLIKDADLVRELQSYKSLWATLENANDTTFRPFRDRTVFAGQDLGLSPFTNISSDELTDHIEANPKLSAAIRTLAEFTILQHASEASLDRRAIDLIDRIKGEIRQ